MSPVRTAPVSRLTPTARKWKNMYKRLPAAQVSLLLWHLRLNTVGQEAKLRNQSRRTRAHWGPSRPWSSQKRWKRLLRKSVQAKAVQHGSALRLLTHQQKLPPHAKPTVPHTWNQQVPLTEPTVPHMEQNQTTLTHQELRPKRPAVKAAQQGSALRLLTSQARLSWVSPSSLQTHQRLAAPRNQHAG